MEPEIRRAFGAKDEDIETLLKAIQGMIEDYGGKFREIIESQNELKEIIKAKD